jgi:intracellular septation protein A
MTRSNPYAPPEAALEDIAESGLRTDYGLKLGASLFWRLMVLQIILMVPVALTLSFSDLRQSTAFLTLKPALFFIVVAASVAVSLQLFRPGLPFLVWGHKLGMLPSSWRRFSWALCGLYLLLGVVNTCVAVAAPLTIWLQYKTFGPPLATLIFCAFVPRFIVRSNPSVERTAPGNPGAASDLKR